MRRKAPYKAPSLQMDCPFSSSTTNKRTRHTMWLKRERSGTNRGRDGRVAWIVLLFVLFSTASALSQVTVQSSIKKTNTSRRWETRLQELD